MDNLIRASARLVFGKLLPRLAYPVMRGPLKGARFILGASSGEGGGATVYFNMSEREQTSAFVAKLKQGEVFFDIGANVGYYTILGSRIVGSRGRVFAFEPVTRNLAYLHQHAVLNKASNVTIVPAACSDTVSLRIFSAGPNFATGHISDKIGMETGAIDSEYPVPTVTVDRIAELMGVSPNVIKIDAEGAELSVLKGAQATLRSAKSKIFLSTHSDALRSTCLEYLKGLGYIIEILSQDKNTPTEFLAEYPDT